MLNYYIRKYSTKFLRRKKEALCERDFTVVGKISERKKCKLEKSMNALRRFSLGGMLTHIQRKKKDDRKKRVV